MPLSRRSASSERTRNDSMSGGAATITERSRCRGPSRVVASSERTSPFSAVGPFLYRAPRAFRFGESAKNHVAAYSGATRSRHTMARGARIETQSTPWKVARGASERARARADHGSAWARARPGTKHTARKAAENGHLEAAIGRGDE